MYLIGVDLGTTGCKSMVFSLSGDILGSDYIEYDLIISEDGCIEQSADIWWNNVKTSVKNAVKSSGIDGKKIKALSVSSQGISFVPVDKDGKVLMNAVSWLDQRASEEAETIKSIYGTQNIFSLTGKQILPAYVLPKLMWIKKNMPEIYQNTWKFMMGMEFLIYNFSGKVATDYSMASGTLAYNVIDNTWYNEIFSKFDIDLQKLPELGCVGDAAGNVLPSVAEEIGLSTDCQVILGAQDQRCASFGAGIKKGIVTVSLGTATAVCSICTEPVIDKNMQVTCCGFNNNYWLLESVIATSGVALKWVKNTFFKDLSYGEMDKLAESAPVGSNGVMFFPDLENKEKGSNGAFTGLGLHIENTDIIRAVFEGISYQINKHIQSHGSLNGPINQICLFGGGAKSDIWAQIIADITGKPVLIPRTCETANLGAAMFAGIGAKVFEDFEDASKMVGSDSKTFVPDPEKHGQYRACLDAYNKLSEKIFK